MALRNRLDSAKICGITVIAAFILCIVVAVGPRVVMLAGGMAGDLRDIDVMAMDD